MLLYYAGYGTTSGLLSFGTLIAFLAPVFLALLIKVFMKKKLKVKKLMNDMDLAKIDKIYKPQALKDDKELENDFIKSKVN